MEEDVGQLQISVYDVFLRQVDEAGEYIFYEGEGLLFCKTVLLFEFGLQIAVLAQFSDYIAIVFRSKSLMVAKNVRMI